MYGEDGKCSGLCGAGLLDDSGCRSGTQVRWLEDVRGSTTKGCNGCCDGKSYENGVAPKKTRLLRKCQSNSSDTILDILNKCFVFLN